MSFQDDDMVQEFAVEANEILDSAESSLLGIEKGEGFTDHYTTLFRAFHNLKGASGMLGFHDVEKVVHHMETLLSHYEGKDNLPMELVTYFLSGVDATRDWFKTGEIAFDLQDENDLLSGSDQFEQASDDEAPESFDNEISSSEDTLGCIAILGNEKTCNELSNVLAGTGFVVNSFFSPKELLDKLDSLGPSIIISEVVVDGSDAFEFIRILKQMEADLPFLLVNNTEGRDVYERGFEEGVCFLERPFVKEHVYNVCLNSINKFKTTHLLNKSINFILYQFSDIDDYLKEKGKEDLRILFKKELDEILKERRSLIVTK